MLTCDEQLYLSEVRCYFCSSRPNRRYVGFTSITSPTTVYNTDELEFETPQNFKEYPVVVCEKHECQERIPAYK